MAPKQIYLIYTSTKRDMSCSSLGTEIAFFQVRTQDWVCCTVFIHGGMQTMYYDRTGTLSIYNMLVELNSERSKDFDLSYRA